jgi:hypothetical protein
LREFLAFSAKIVQFDPIRGMLSFNPHPEAMTNPMYEENTMEW